MSKQRTGKDEVESLMLEKLAASGLDKKDARKLKMQPMDEAEAGEATNFDEAGFKIPYFSVNGEELPFWRFRFLTNRKKGKYFQPKGTGVAVYFPPLIDWATRIEDAKKSIIVTEGELKAACATKLGYPTIGLGGVWSFKSKKKERDFIEDLEQIEWQGRSTFLCFDSDATTNPKVMQAECALARELDRRGAKVYIARLPALSKGGKTGIDDYLMSRRGGVKRFMRLLGKAEEWSKSAALREFNNEVILIRDPGVCVIRATGQRVDTNTLVHTLYANRVYWKASPTEKDPLRRVEASVPADWIKWEGRAEAEKMTYRPGEGEITSSKEYNMWKGWGTNPVKGDVEPWTKLLDYAFKDADPRDRKWFEQWCAYPIQHPGTKLYTACVLWSVKQGTGKSLIGYTLGRIYGDNYIEIKDHDIESTFNSFMVNKQFILGDEITGTDGLMRRKLANKLKGMITQLKATVNQKYVSTYEIPDCVNYLFTSQHCDAFFIENADRRFFVNEIRGMPLPLGWYRKTYDPWYKSKAGIEALHYHLLHLDCRGFDPHAPAPMTDSKRTMIEEGRSDLMDWIESVSQYNGAKKLMTSEEVLVLALGQGKTMWSKNGITRALHSAGYMRPLGNQQQLVLPDGRQVRPWLIDRQMPVPPRSEVTQKWVRDLWFSDRPMGSRKFKEVRAEATKRYEDEEEEES
jgi:hypothetical protein